MSRVFLVEPVRREFDLESLKDFGEITFLFQPDERRGSVFRTEEFCASILARLSREDFDPELDFFCLTGALVPVSLTLSIMSHLFGMVNVLLYNTGDENYASRKVEYEVDNKVKDQA